MIKIWDFYINEKDEILYLCEFDGDKAHWIIEDEIKIGYIKEFYEFKKAVEEKNKDEYTDVTCKTLRKKPFGCEIKCKTRGLLISAYNCGIINGFREIFVSESISQVLLFFLDIIEINIK